jgi:hypothetical protein
MQFSKKFIDERIPPQAIVVDGDFRAAQKRRMPRTHEAASGRVWSFGLA